MTLDEMIEIERTEGREEGIAETKRETAGRMKSMGYDIDSICKITDLPKAEVLAL